MLATYYISILRLPVLLCYLAQDYDNVGEIIGFIALYYIPICSDINECTNGDAECDKDHGDCENKVGSYRCFCKAGYMTSNVSPHRCEGESTFLVVDPTSDTKCRSEDPCDR